MSIMPDGPLINSQNTLSRHSGACQNQVKTIVYSALSGKLVPDVFTRICPIFVLSRPTSCLHAVVDAGRFGLHVLSRHFLHPVGRIHQHDEVQYLGTDSRMRGNDDIR
jgi:hypothetical protein